ncbi:S1C family serine protease [Ornithinimicrobium faecis]|uniref:S1C family serine protease n=1 Tax=Ornithinimicrobium faecis TaxID=2934158 RepID=UPI0021182ADB|nr:trypsin-like peptidase domain-containing protein [Ornithinimicrobium sp. HY1745]
MADERDPEDADRPGLSPDERPASPTGYDDTTAASIDHTSAIPVEHTTSFPPYPGGDGAGPTGGSWSRPGGGTAEAHDRSVGHAAYASPSPQGSHPAYLSLSAPADHTAYRQGSGATATHSRTRRGPGLGLLTGALLLGLLGGGAAGYLGAQFAQDEQEPAPSIVEAAPVGTTPPTAITAIAQHALPSVVFISVGSTAGEGVGSGFVVRDDGYIVTNNHVIEGASDGAIGVTFADGRETTAELVGADPEYDIAVIKVDETGLQALEFGDSDALAVGATVVAVGAPLGLDNTVTAGIVSALNRPVMAGGGAGPMSYINAIQTDAAINPGNSGGPLLDLNGQVVGVNSAIAQIPGDLGGQSGSIGLGFSIPARQVEHTANQLIETGTSNHPIIGVMLDMTHTGAGAKVLEDGQGEGPSIVEGGPADDAGVEPGDLILAVDGEEVDHGSHLIIILRSHEIGDEVELLLQNPDGDERTVTMTLQGSE